MLGKGMGMFGGAAIGALAFAVMPAAALAQEGAGQQGAPSVDLVLVGVAVLAGIVVGLIPALVLGAVLGIVPRPAWARAGGWAPTSRVEMAARAPAVTLGFAPGVAEEPAVPAPARAVADEPAVPALARAAAEASASPAPPVRPPEVVPEVAARPPVATERPPEPRERHRELYEAEFSWQEHRLHALRQSIRRRLEDPPDGGGPR